MTEKRHTERRTYGPAVVATRLAVRRTLQGLAGGEAGERPLVLVALSGGADSLALALALAYEAPKLGVRAGAVIVDHGLQTGSGDVARAAARQAEQLGLDPVRIESVRVETATDGGGPEAAARSARYAAFVAAVAATGAGAILTAHTHDDQAEQVMLALARGSGLRSLAGIPVRRELRGSADRGERAGANDVLLLRPFLAAAAEAGGPVITRRVTEAACDDQGVSFWRDPHNEDHAYARVRVRRRVLPMLEAELGPGVADALVRTAALAREDADALDSMALEFSRGLLAPGAKELQIKVTDLSGLAAPVLYRVIRVLAQEKFGAYLERVHTLSIAALVTEWRGQGPVFVPGMRVTRVNGELVFEEQVGSPRQ